jgi:hypothetical protein
MKLVQTLHADFFFFFFFFLQQVTIIGGIYVWLSSALESSLNPLICCCIVDSTDYVTIFANLSTTEEDLSLFELCGYPSPRE